VPELPEVETIVRGLSRVVLGRRIRDIVVVDAKVAGPDGAGRLVAALSGRELSTVSRFGKYLEFGFADGSTLVAHLRMTGKFIFLDPAPPAGEVRYARLVFYFERGGGLYFCDPRRFGTLRYYAAGLVPVERAKTAPDPLEAAMTLARFSEILAASRQPVKQVLLDQRRISGIGNIYACEALFRAALDPRRPARALLSAERARLLRELRRILRQAIAQNGTTISDFRSIDDKSGGFQDWLRVYGHEGEPCRQCRESLVRIRQGGRSTYFCPRCQS